MYDVQLRGRKAIRSWDTGADSDPNPDSNPDVDTDPDLDSNPNTHPHPNTNPHPHPRPRPRKTNDEANHSKCIAHGQDARERPAQQQLRGGRTPPAQARSCGPEGPHEDSHSHHT